MTIVETRTDTPAVAPPPPPPPADARPSLDPPDDAVATPSAPTETGAQSLVKALIVLLAFAIVLVVLWKAFDQVVAPAHYHARQQHLAADYGAQRPGLEIGQAAGVLQIPGIGANLIISEGAGVHQLRGGPGHLEDTPLPTKRGNSVIEGHRSRWGAPFGELDQLVKRTRIVAMDRSGLPIEYRVTTVKVVKRAQLSKYFANTHDFRITLVTQAGGSFSDDRLIVQAVAGTPETSPDPDRSPPVDPPQGSIVLPVFGFLLASGLAVLAALRLRRDHGLVVVAMVVVPLALLAILSFLLGVDSTLPPLL